MDIDELIARPLDAVERLRAEIKAKSGDASEDRAEDGGIGLSLAEAIAEALKAGPCPALDRVPVLSRKSFAEVGLPFFIFLGRQR